MSQKLNRNATIATILAGPFPWLVAAAQNAPTASLVEQLRAQYKAAKMSPQDSGATVLEPGTVLVIQKTGIPTVPYVSATVCPARYLDGKVDSPEGLCPETVKKDSRPFKVGEKVYPVQIDVDQKKERITFRIVACDSCNGTNPATSSKSEVIFQFAQGYLEKTSVPEVEDTIGDVLAMDDSNVRQTTRTQTEDTGPTVLTNNMVIRMATAKLGDGVILGAIKTSPCSFDTKPDALIKLKQAGVSDAVLQAMIETGTALQPSTAPASIDASVPPEPPSSEPRRTTFPVQHRHINLVGSETYYYCSGDLSILADGTVKYDCTQTDDPSGRCDHVPIPGGYLKQAKVGYNGALHLATKGQGNFDFFADATTIQNALAAVAPLVGREPVVTTGTVAQPPTPTASSCPDYESCMKQGTASLEQPDGGAQALTEFQKASQLNPSKSEPLAGKGYAYLQMGQYDNAAYMWDRALGLGATLSSPVCHAGVACGDTGELLLSTKEVSFVNKKGEKKFFALPSAVTSDVGTPTVIGGKGRIAAYYVQLVSSGKNYRFYYSPKSPQCRSNFLCPEPGLTQQKVFAEYVHNTLVKLAAGDFDSKSSKP